MGQVGEWRNGLSAIWTGKIDIHFAYKFGEERTRRDVTLENIYKSQQGEGIFYGFCHLRNEYRHFYIAAISSKIRILPNKKFYHTEELLDLLIKGKNQKK